MQLPKRVERRLEMFRKFSGRFINSVTFLPVLLLILGLLSLTIQADAQDSGVIVGPQIDIYTGAGSQQEPHVAFDSINNRFLVAWLDDSVGFPDYPFYIYGQLVNADRSLYGSPIPISISGTSYIQRGTSNVIAFDPHDQRFLVVWYDWRNGTGNIYGQLVNADGSLYGDNFAISPIPPLNDHKAGVPTVSFDTINNRFLVVWVGPSAGTPANIYGQLVNPDGSLHGSMMQITDYADYYAAYPDIAFDSNNERFLVTWGQQYDEYIYGRLVNADGSLYGSEITVGYYSGSYVASLSFDPINSRFLIAYNINTGNNIFIWGQLIDADGTLYGSEFKITHYYTLFPCVVFDTFNNKFLLVGYGAKIYNGVFKFNGVFGQFLNPDGSLHGSDFTILNGANSWPLDPFVAFGTGEIGSLVVWSDTPNGYVYDVFGKFVKIETPEPLPDLTGEWTKFNVYHRKKITIIVGEFDVRNVGTQEAETFKVAYYISDDGVLDEGDTLIRTKTISSLAAGESVTLQFLYRSRVPIQGKFIIAELDSDDEVLESDEGNNVVPSPKIQ